MAGPVATIVGIGLCSVISMGLIYSKLPLLWEAHYPDGSYPITWRSGLILLALLAVTQWVASVAFKRIGGPKLKSKSGSL